MGDPRLSVVPGLRAAGDALRARGYEWERVKARTALGWQLPYPVARLDEADTPAASDDERPPLDWLIRLLLFGEAVPARRLDGCLEAAARTALQDAGVLREEGGEARAEVMLLPWRDLILACDWPWRDVADRVTMPDPSSAFTAEHVEPLPGEPAGRAVDVGTGCGIVALVAARHFGPVLGVDVNPRAVAYARVNAALNGRAAEFEPCGPDFLRDELDAPADLVSFVLPVLLPGYWRRPAPAHVSQVAPGVDGRALAFATYRALPDALRPGGRGLLLHQVPLDPGDDLPAWLDRAGALERLTCLANELYRSESGFAFVRASLHHTDTPGRLEVVPGPNRLFGAPQTRADLLRHLATRAVLARGPDALDAAVPRLYDWVEASSTRRGRDGVLGPPERTLDELPVDERTWAAARALDGRSTVAELGLDRPAVRELALAGVVHLAEPARRILIESQ